MSKIKLGKTKDSRTRKQPVKAVNTTEQEKLLTELKNQQEFTAYLLLKGYSTSTTKRYVKDVEKFIEWSKKENVQIEQVSYSDVLHYIQSKRNHVKQRTISTIINSIKHYFNFLAITDQTLENPTRQIQIKGVKRKTLYHILSKQELESLYNNFKIPTTKTHRQLAAIRNKVILGLIIYQGLGSTELARLTEKDIQLREGKIYIAGTRRSNERTLKLEAHQILDMMEYALKTRQEILNFRKNDNHSDLLFLSVGESNHFSNLIQKLTQKLNKQNSKITTIQQIRTSVITHWLKNYNLRQVQYMAGHRYVSSTEAYFVNDLDDLQEDISKFHPIG